LAKHFFSKNKYFLFLKALLHRFSMDGCMYRASALTLTSLLSVVPLMLVTVSVLAAFPVFAKFGDGIQTFIFNNFVPASGQVVQEYLNGFVSKAGQLSLIGIGVLLVTAVLMLFNIEQAFNVIWRVETRRKGLVAFLLYWAILTLSPLLLGFSLATSSYIISLPLIADTATKFGLMAILLGFLPFVLAVFAFMILYVAIPNCRVPLKDGFISAVITAVLFELAKYGFTFYIKSFNSYEILYGALAALPMFLLWVYLSWIIILFGAELCHSLTYRLSESSHRKLDAFTHAYLWLGYLWIGQKAQKSLTLAELVKLDQSGYMVDPEHQIQALIQAKLVRKTSGGRYVLGVDLHALEFWALVRTLPWKVPEKMTSTKQHPWLDNLSNVIEKINMHKQAHNPKLTEFYT